MGLPLTPERARIFRISHVDNLGWMLANGVCCRSSGRFDPNYRNIGNVDLIRKRTTRVVPIAPGGTLSDYVPFYFTSRSPMLLNIKTGMNVAAVPMREIMILVASLRRLAAASVPFVFTDRHAYLVSANFSSDLSELASLVDWDILQRSDFRYDPQDMGKLERYQAEALVYQRLPFEFVDGIIVYDEVQKTALVRKIEEAGLTTPVEVDRRFFV